MPCPGIPSCGLRPVSILLCGCGLWLTAAGCGSHRNRELVVGHVREGEYGQARAAVASKLEADIKSRGYVYDRMRLAMILLADGLPEVAETLTNDVFRILRTQGLNADRTVAAVLTWEGIKIWKGEPFEQAMMYFYVAVQKAMLGEWDNARAASLNSLFLLKDFGRNELGTRKTTEQIAAEAVRKERDQKRADHLEAGYSPVETTFALGYLINAVANMAMAADDPDRKAEAEDCLAKAEAINVRIKDEQKLAYAAQAQAIEAQLAASYQVGGNDPRWRAQLDQYRANIRGAAPESQPDLSPVLARLRSRAFNTILVVDYGLGPTKERYGMDDVFARFQQLRGWHGTEPLRIKVNGNPDEPVPVACNLNDMAADHMWNNMEDVRKAKSHIGTAVLAAGAAYAASGRDEYGIGAAVMLVGLAIKESAKADTRHCEIMPQRVYFAPITIPRPDSTVELRIGEPEGAPLMVLCGLDPPPDSQRIQLRYVRLPARQEPPKWATSGRVYYANEYYDSPVPGEELPCILGGRCVRKPTHETLTRYQRAGQLAGVTLDELLELYAAEGIAVRGPDEPNAVHVLEGGNSLACPLPGTVGFTRLFGQEHGPYRPRSAALEEFKRRVGLAHEASIAVARQERDHGSSRSFNPVRKVGLSRSPGGSGNRKP